MQTATTLDDSVVAAVNRKALGDAHQDVAYNLANLAFVELDRGQNDIALAGFTDAVARMRKLYPGPHPRWRSHWSDNPSR